jgi:hypothetical protein
MARLTYPLQFFVVALAGWINQQPRDVIDYLHAENRVLREQLSPRRLRFTDDQRIRLAAKAKLLQRRVLQEIGTIVSPDTLLAWHRHLIARKYDGHHQRGPTTVSVAPSADWIGSGASHSPSFSPGPEFLRITGNALSYRSQAHRLSASNCLLACSQSSSPGSNWSTTC